MALGRLDTFVNDWPRYNAVLKRTATDRRSQTHQRRSAGGGPHQPEARPRAARVEDAQPVRTLLLRGLGSLYSILLVWTFLPFLVFFMLAAKRKIWQSTLELFPEGERHAARETLDQVSSMLRSYMAGNALVAAILIAACAAFFWSIHLDYPVLMGVVAGSLNMIPYLGVGAFLAAAVRDRPDALEDGRAFPGRGRRADRPALCWP